MAETEKKGENDHNSLYRLEHYSFIVRALE
jgi:hypothetical protein